MSIILGFERLIDSGRIRGHRVGLVCNLASIDKNLQHISTRFANEPSVTLNALFGPQHGFESNDQDNMVETSHSHHSIHDIPIYSLYSETRTPTTDMLRDLDVLVIDLQDVGTRVYTYLYTMANCLRACRQHDIPVIVADRPNPIGGISVEGPLLDETYSSFVGQFAIPLRHGMTIGEVANLFNDHFGIGAKLEVFKMEGWTRQMYFDDTSLPWIPPSPNLPTLDSAIVYPGNVLIEGTNLSEGRGTQSTFLAFTSVQRPSNQHSKSMLKVFVTGARFTFTIEQHLNLYSQRRPCFWHVSKQIRISSAGENRPTNTNTLNCQSISCRVQHISANTLRRMHP